MKIKIRTGNIRFSMPVPIGMAGLAIRAIPQSEIEKMRREAPEAYRELISKETFLTIFEACKDIIKEHKGLEVVHVEAHDGTFVSIRL